MILKYQSDFLSIRKFPSIEIPNFTVLTGLNGSGKTHLLQALENGRAQIELINTSEIVYYSYNDFIVHKNTPNIRSSKWGASKQFLFTNLNNIGQEVYNILVQNKSPFEQYLCSLLRSPHFNYREILKTKQTEELLEEIKQAKNPKKELQNHIDKISSSLFMILNNYFQNNTDIEIISIQFIVDSLEKLRNESDSLLKEIDPDLYKYVKGSFEENNFLSVQLNDIESPDIILKDIENEEREYQLVKAQNSLNKAHATDWDDNITYYEKDIFIAIHGISPIEQINEVLNEYDCNGYYLYADPSKIKLGVDISQMQVRIVLRRKLKQYSTTFDQLSSGEKTLIALSLLIFKTRKKRSIIPRVLLLDEVDSSLHPSMIKRLLNVIQEIFIKKLGLKVILATHSPTTVALSPPDSIFSVDFKDKCKVSKIDQSNGISILTEGFASLSSENSELGIGYNISNTDLPILFTEGITDKLILETAWSKLHPNEEQPFYIQDCFDASFLANLFKRGFDAQDGIFINYSSRKLIALFDFDYAGFNAWNSMAMKQGWEKIGGNPYCCLTKRNKNGFVLLLPVPKENKITKQVIKEGNQTYNNESCLAIELLFWGIKKLDSFYEKETIVGGGEIIKFKKDKKKFAQEIKTLTKIDFINFTPLFKKVIEIINTA